jgi:hypothetical protein
LPALKRKCVTTRKVIGGEGRNEITDALLSWEQVAESLFFIAGL